MKNNLLICFMILLFSTSCNHDKEKYYRLDHSNWFKYNIHDTLMFKSISSVDSFYISQIINDFDVYDKKYYYEGFSVIYKGVNGNNKCKELAFGRESDYVGFGGTLYSSDIKYSSKDKLTYKIGDTSIENVYFLLNIPVDTNHFKVKAIYYNDIYGIIRYDLYNDEVFELQLK